MTRFVLILLCLSFFSCRETDTLPESGPDPESGFALSPVPGSDVEMAIRKDETGNLLEKGYFRNGKKEGVWMIYQTGEEAGRVGTLVSYLDGKRNGIYMEFDRRGQIELEATYLNNQLEGRHARYRFGRILEEAEYKSGQLHGLHKKYYENSAKLQTETEYRQGEQDGFYRFYGEDGELMLEYEYKDGKKVSGGMVGKEEG